MNITELDFDQIKANITEYFKRSDSPFKDWDFEGSGLALITSLLAYNTQYNAVLAHHGFNETILDTAQLRKNVVARAKYLSYTPRSIKAPKAFINVSVADAAYTILPAQTRFTSVIDGVTYTFTTIEDISRSSVSGGVSYFGNVEVYQGALKSLNYQWNSNDPTRRFVINDLNADTSTLAVTIFESVESNVSSVWSSYKDMASITPTSKIFFLEENSSGLFELSFGDNIISAQPKPLNVISITYVSTAGTAANGCKTFTYSGGADTNANVSVTTVSVASGGAERESISSIKKNAPLYFAAQNRAVTVNDYKAIIASLISAETISVWGGEDNPSPQYGKVFVSIKPSNAEVLTDSEKRSLASQIRSKNLLTIIPEFVDPIYTYLYFDVNFQYNSQITSKAPSALRSLVTNVITSYNDTYLEKFDGIFRYSRFLDDIDNADTSIVSSLARVYMYKKQLLTSTTYKSYVVGFALEIHGTLEQIEPTMTTSQFMIGGQPHVIEDRPPLDGTLKRYLVLKRVLADGSTVVVSNNAGRLDLTTGQIDISAIKPDADIEIKIHTSPASNDVVPKRNQLLSFDIASTSISASVDPLVSINKFVSFKRER